jgi:hypothetical protein
MNFSFKIYFLHIQKKIKLKKGKEAYLLGQIGSAHSEIAPRLERFPPAKSGV